MPVGDLDAEIETRLRSIDAVADESGNGEVGIFRISHLGGHRYAGVMIVSPPSTVPSAAAADTGVDLFPVRRNALLWSCIASRDSGGRQGDDSRWEDLVGAFTVRGECCAARVVGSGGREGCQGGLSAKGEELVKLVGDRECGIRRLWDYGILYIRSNIVRLVVDPTSEITIV